jgi:hypothetical protein
MILHKEYEGVLKQGNTFFLFRFHEPMILKVAVTFLLKTN